jgi:undecaprenyl diphosphate synthase
MNLRLFNKLNETQVRQDKLLPRHVAIIMDGNGRWAKKHGLSRSQGHRRGVQRVREIVEEAAKQKIEVLTLYAFSTENWKRPRREIELLMRLLVVFLKKEIKNLVENNIRLNCIGRIELFPDVVVKMLEQARSATEQNSGLVLNLALNYGGRKEILDAVNKIIEEKKFSTGKAQIINEDEFSRYLYTAGLPDPDLMIRTSGEQRISNFLLWQLSYSELYFSPKFWPDFTRNDFLRALRVYQGRIRRFGGI